MSLWKIAWRSIQDRGLSSWLTALSMALGVALVVVVLVIHGTVADSFKNSADGYHLIVGAKGGKLQLVLNTVFHLSQPIENIPYSYYKEFTTSVDEHGHKVRGKYSRNVDVVVPYCLGDSYQGFRVVGTTPDMFDKLNYGYDDSTKTFKTYSFSQGRNFKDGSGDFATEAFEAVVGSVAAYKTGLKVGDKFAITHGLADEEDAHVHENEKFTVVGILDPTGTPNDRAIFINMEGFYLIADHAKPVPKEEKPKPHDEHEHDDHDHNEKHADDHKDLKKDGHDHEEEPDHEENHDDHDDHGHHDHHGHGHAPLKPLPENQREITAFLLTMDDDLSAMNLHRVINEGQVAQAVQPSKEITNLFQGIVGNVQLILLVLTILIVIQAGISVMVSIYNSMKDRSWEIAIMRSLGADRSKVMLIVLTESIMLSCLGGLVGVVIGHGAVGLMNPYVVSQTGVSVSMFQFSIWELVLVPGLIVLASIVGYLPAVTAYRTDVAKALSASP